MTNYSELNDEEKRKVKKDLRDEPVVFHYVVKGDSCAVCYMMFYNCLCSHDN